MKKIALIAIVALVLSAWISGVTQQSPGPSSGQMYYISSTGNDSRDGKTPATAWLTIGKANGFTFAVGDSLFIDAAGSALTDATLLLKGAGTGLGAQNIFPTSTNSFLVGAYNTTRCSPYNNTGCAPISPASGQCVVIANISYVTVRDLNCVGADPTTQGQGIYLRNNDNTGGGATYGNVTVLNNRVTGFDIGIIAEGTVGHAGWDSFSILQNYVVGTVGTEENGIYVRGPALRTLSNSNCVVSGNVVNNMFGVANKPAGTSGNGILIAETNGCVSKFNLAMNGGANTNTCGGPAGNWAYDANNVTFQYNETASMGPTSYTAGCDWNGFDCDNYTTNCIIEYNYAHDNWGGGFIAAVTATTSWQNNIYRYNLGVNNASTDAAGGYGCVTIGNIANLVSNLQVYNNTCSTAANASGPGNSFNGYNFHFLADYGPGAKVSNNIMYSTGNAGCLKVDGTFSGTINGNDCFRVGSTGPVVNYNSATYNTLAAFRAATGFEVNGIQADPMFFMVGVLCVPLSVRITTLPFGWPPCPTVNYEIKVGSPVLGVGLVIPNPGGNDFFTFPVPNPNVGGTHYNIGAWGSSGQ